MSGLFSAAAEVSFQCKNPDFLLKNVEFILKQAAEEAIYNSLCGAVDVVGHRRVAHCLPTEAVVAELRKRGALRE